MPANASAGIAHIRVPSLNQFDASSFGPRIVMGRIGDVDTTIIDAPDAARTLPVLAALVFGEIGAARSPT